MNKIHQNSDLKEMGVIEKFGEPKKEKPKKTPKEKDQKEKK